MNSLVKKIKENPYAIFGKGASEEDVIVSEAKLELKFAPEYREYLLELAIASIDGCEYTGLSKSQRVNVVAVTSQQRNLNSDIAHNWYVIEETNIDGIVIWQSSEGAVFQTAPGLIAKKIADSFADYIS